MASNPSLNGLRSAANPDVSDPWDDYYAQLDQISQDPDVANQNFGLRMLKDPNQEQNGPGGMWDQYYNLMKHRGAMEGRTYQFNPQAMGIAQRGGQIDREEQGKRRDEQYRRMGGQDRVTGFQGT